MDFSKYVMHMWHFSWYSNWQFFNFLPLPGRQFSSSPWQAAGKACGKTTFQPSALATYFQVEVNARNKEVNNIAYKKFNEYMAQ